MAADFSAYLDIETRTTQHSRHRRASLHACIDGACDGNWTGQILRASSIGGLLIAERRTVELAYRIRPRPSTVHRAECTLVTLLTARKGPTLTRSEDLDELSHHCRASREETSGK